MRDLIDIDEYKVYKNITSTEQDEILEQIIPSVSTLVKSYCARTFIDNYDLGLEEFTPIVEIYNGGETIYYTSEQPIQGITSIEYSEDYGQTYTALVEFTDYVLDLQNDRIALFNGDLISIPNALKITYTGGYINLPNDLKLAVLDLISYYLKRESVPRKTSGSNVSIEYITNSDFPPHIKRILDLYRIIK